VTVKDIGVYEVFLNAIDLVVQQFARFRLT